MHDEADSKEIAAAHAGVVRAERVDRVESVLFLVEPALLQSSQSLLGYSLALRGSDEKALRREGAKGVGSKYTMPINPADNFQCLASTWTNWPRLS